MTGDSAREAKRIKRTRWIGLAAVVSVLAGGVVGGVFGAGIEMMLGQPLFQVQFTETDVIAFVVFLYGFLWLAGRDLAEFTTELVNND